MYTDILIIGAGVTGCSVARVLSRYEASIAVIDRGADVAEGASKANSGIVHAGFDAHPGTLKAKLNVEGAKMYPDLCAQLGVPYSQPGALVLGFSEADRATLTALVAQGVENGVPGVCLIERDEVLALEPNTNPDVLCALYAPTSGLTSPYEMTYALADHAAVNGVRFMLGEEVEGLIKAQDGLWHVTTDKGEHTCKILVNCAGVGAATLHNMMSGDLLHIIDRRGQYYLLDRMQTLPFKMTMFQCPTKMGKGVLVSPTVHGNLLLGPSAEDIEDELDTSTTAEGLEFVLKTCPRPAAPSPISPASARMRRRATSSSVRLAVSRTPMRPSASRARACPPRRPSARCSARRSPKSRDLCPRPKSSRPSRAKSPSTP